MENNILELNDFITYDCNKEKFIVKKHIIEIPEMEFSFDDLKGGSKNAIKYKGFMKSIAEEGATEKFKKSRQYGKGGTNGNGKGRDYKKSIEKFIISMLGINKIFDIFSTYGMSLSLKKVNKLK